MGASSPSPSGSRAPREPCAAFLLERRRLDRPRMEAQRTGLRSRRMRRCRRTETFSSWSALLRCCPHRTEFADPSGERRLRCKAGAGSRANCVAELTCPARRRELRVHRRPVERRGQDRDRPRLRQQLQRDPAHPSAVVRDEGDALGLRRDAVGGDVVPARGTTGRRAVSPA